MPTSNQAKKRVRQNEKHRLRHKARKTEIKTLVKKATATIKEEKDLKNAAPQVAALQKKLDKAAAFRSIHKNAANRKKSRLQRKLNKLAAAAKTGGNSEKK